MAEKFTQMQIMLSLAYLANREFWNPIGDNQHNLETSFNEGLENIETLKGDWELAWGPSSYRHKVSLFDSSLMYVVQHRRHRSRYGIVVRGTNPVDMFDWLFGDFLIHRQVPWQPAGRSDIAPGAKLSLSTALGLKILLNMRSAAIKDHTPDAGAFSYLFDRGVSSLHDVSSDTHAVAKDFIRRSAEGRLAYRKAHQLWRKLFTQHGMLNFAAKVSADVSSSLATMMPSEQVFKALSARRRVIKVLDVILDNINYSPVDVLMPDSAELFDEDSPGVGFLELLGSLAETHGNNLELFITGHSKGGALAPALALFLSDTQNTTAIPRQYQWNPNATAKIHCYAFAGPTPGNSQFAKYFNQQLGKRFYSHVNSEDLVTRAWNYEQVCTISSIYGDSVKRNKLMDTLFNQMAEEVKDKDYCHLGEDYTKWRFLGKAIDKHVIKFAGPLKENCDTYLLQVAYQHVDAYLNDLGLNDLISKEELMGFGKQ